MAGKTKAATRKATSPRPLKESFEKVEKKKRQTSKGSPKKRQASSSSAAAAAAAAAAGGSNQIEPTRSQQCGFLSYIGWAQKSKSDDVCSQACQLNSYYHTLAPTEKKALILEFHRSGGKKGGLECVFKQMMKIKEEASNTIWEGYTSFDGLCELHKVSCGLAYAPPPSPKDNNQQQEICLCP